MAFSNAQNLQLVERLMSPQVQLPPPLFAEEVAAKLSDEEVGKVFIDHVPGVQNFLFRQRAGEYALQHIQNSYRHGWEAFRGNEFNSHLKWLLRLIVHYGHEGKPGAERYLQEVAEAFMNCQAVQARIVEQKGLQICGVARDFQGLVTALVGEYKQIAFKTLVAERIAQGHESGSADPIHYENRLATDVGHLIGLNAEDVRRASLDTHAHIRYRKLSSDEAEAAAFRCREFFDLQILLQALVCELNSFNEASPAESLPGSFWLWCSENLQDEHIIFDEDSYTHLQVDQAFALAVLEVLFLGKVSSNEATFRGKKLKVLFSDVSPCHKRCRVAANHAEHATEQMMMAERSTKPQSLQRVAAFPATSKAAMFATRPAAKFVATPQTGGIDRPRSLKRDSLGEGVAATAVLASFPTSSSCVGSSSSSSRSSSERINQEETAPSSCSSGGGRIQEPICASLEAVTIEAISSIWGSGTPDCPAPEMLREGILDRFLMACEACRGFSCGIKAMFHRTKEQNTEGISECGLLIADGINVPMAHGNKLGRGIYLSPQFDHGRKYGNVSILCLVLPGHELPASSSTWPASSAPGAYFSKLWDDIVFVCCDEAQVLPLAVVQDHNWAEARSKALIVGEVIEDCIPGLRKVSRSGTSSPQSEVDESPWQRVESSRQPGRFYYWNRITGESLWQRVEFSREPGQQHDRQPSSVQQPLMAMLRLHTLRIQHALRRRLASNSVPIVPPVRDYSASADEMPRRQSLTAAEVEEQRHELAAATGELEM